MSTVTNTLDSPVQYAPKAANTVETLTPKAAPEPVKNPLVQEYKERGGSHGLPSSSDLDAVAAEATAKAKTAAKDKFVPGQFEGDTESIKEANRVNAEWAIKPVSRFEFQELADAVQDLADRIKLHNTRAPYKI